MDFNCQKGKETIEKGHIERIFKWKKESKAKMSNTHKRDDSADRSSNFSMIVKNIDIKMKDGE